MELTENRCQRCGGLLDKTSDTSWKCKYCGSTYDDTTARENAKKMRELFDEAKRERINNLRRMLYDATTAEFISSTDVKNACVELKKYLPDDFRANFYEIAVGNNERRLTSAIRKIDVEANFDEIGNIVSFLIKSLQPGFVLELNNLVERAYKQKDLPTFERLSTEISIQAEKVEQGIYETKLPREVFVAYSSKDMDKVSDLVEVLESQGIKCFVAARNLRHGKGAVENYDAALKDAMDHCKSFVFVSSLQSRSFSCDAVKIEIPYIESQDKLNAPPEYRNNYTAIPHQYKKPRVEYRIEQSSGFNAADQITEEFFDGYEWALSPEEVAVRITKQLFEVPVVVSEAKPEKAATTPPPAPTVAPKPPVSNKKYCIFCGTEVDKSGTICPNCARREFADSISDYIKIKNQRDIDERKRKEIAAAAARAVHSSGNVVSGGSTTPNRGLASAISKPSSTPSSSSKKKKKLGCGTFILITIAVIAAIAIIGALIDSASIPEYTPNGGNGGSGGDDWIIQGGNSGGGNSEDAETIPGFDINSGEVEKGSWGSVNYAFDKSSGILLISGSGEIPAASDMGYYPWGNSTSNALRELRVEGNITKIGNGAFAYMYDLAQVTLCESVEEIDDYAFAQTGITSIYAPGVKTIGCYAFESCTQLRDLSFESLEVIESYAFSSSYWLYSIEMLSIKRIESGAFSGCSDLEVVTVGEECNYVGYNAFNDTAIISYVSAGNPLYIGNCLVKVSTDTYGTFEVQMGTRHIADWAAGYCTNISAIIIPKSVTSIGVEAFYQTQNVEMLAYLGSEEEWANISFGEFWNDGMGIWTSNGQAEMIYFNGQYNPDDFATLEALSFTKNEDGESYCVTGFSSSSLSDSQLNIRIPATYLGLPVTGIGYSVFSNESITGIEIPESVVWISESAFINCQNLVYVNIAENSRLESIGNYAFQNCTSLTSVNIGAGSILSEIGENAFSGCTSLESFTLPASVETVGVRAFDACSSLKNFNFAEGSKLASIPAYMLTGSIIEKIEIPASVTEIGNYALQAISTLTSVSFAEGSQLKTVGEYAFYECKGITSMEFPHSLETLPTSSLRYTSIESLTIPTTVNFYFGSWDGTYFEHLTTLIINGGDTIKSYFYGDKYIIKHIVIGDTVTTIEESALSGWHSLKTLVIGANVETIGSSAFASNAYLESVTFKGTSIESIPTNAFYGSSSLTSITIPEGVESIGDSAFENCEFLSEVNLPDSLTLIDDDAFLYCNALEYITLPGNITSIDYRAFLGSGLKKIVVPDSVEYIGEGAFSNCTALEEIILPASITKDDIGSNAFYNTVALRKVTGHVDAISKLGYKSSLEEAVIIGGTTIPSYTFQDCYKLRSVTLPEGLDTVSQYAFSNCTSLMTIEIPSSVTGCSKNAFDGCIRLVEVIDNTPDGIMEGRVSTCLNLTSGPSSLEYVDGFAFLTVDTEAYLVGYVGEDTTIVFPAEYKGSTYNLFPKAFHDTNCTNITINGIEDIPESAFQASRIVELVIGETVKTIGYKAFYSCGALNSVIIGDNVTTISESAFEYCRNMSSLKIGSSVTRIGNYAFQSCANALTTVIIPASVEVIGSCAFNGCSSLTSVRFEYNSYMCVNSETDTEGTVLSLKDSTDNAENLVNYSPYGYRYWIKVN